MKIEKICPIPNKLANIKNNKINKMKIYLKIVPVFLLIMKKVAIINGTNDKKFR